MTASFAPARPARAVNWQRVLTAGMLTVIGVSFLVGLGVWQLERRLWKLDLLNKVAVRVHELPHAVPDAAAVEPAAHEFEHIDISGTYLRDADTWVHASTDLGAGYWVMSPLRIADGSLVLINRGFVPMDLLKNNVLFESTARVTGLLRSSEPNQAWPRRNAPSQDRWYSRDVAAISAARGLGDVAPFFIDADAAPASHPTIGPVRPLGGLTVIHFRNTHLSYALTWFVLALMTTTAGAYVVLGEYRGYSPLP